MSIRSMVLTSLFAALLAVSSQIYFPIGPVPHTLQVFFVMLAGTVLGSRWGAASIGIWILLGVFGLPVFTQGKAGLATLLGPTGGFLVGFLLCAFFVGWLIERYGVSYRVAGIAMLLGLAVIYSVGLAGFMISFQYFLHKPMSWDKAWFLAVAPFLPFDLVKTLLAAYIGIRVRRALRQAGLDA